MADSAVELRPFDAAARTVNFCTAPGPRRCSSLLSDDEAVSELLEEHATAIARRFERDAMLMEDNPVSERLRRDALRDMPQCLTVKRSIKAKLTKSVSKNSKRRPLGSLKQWKYKISMTFVKLGTTMKNVIYSFELWYTSLKAIEGHFGSGVATYFKFLRWIFLMNFLICIPTVGFIVLPQLVYRFYDHFPEGNDTIQEDVSLGTDKFIERMPFSNYMKPKIDPYKNNLEFSFVNLITGEGFLTNTTLYYGFYTNETINLISNLLYNMQYAYFLTMLFVYGMAFVVLSVSMAGSYRKNFIETSGGLKNIFAHKIFCGWDYSIATKEGATLKKAAIYNEIKELLSDDDVYSQKMTFISKFWTRTIQIVCHLFVTGVLAGIALLMWSLLETNHQYRQENSSILTAIVVSIIMTLGPFCFTGLIRFEDYKTPRIALYISLFRTFQLEIVVVGVLVIYWLNNAPNEQCWETSLAQEIYRLILVDFLFSVLFTSCIELLRHMFYKCISKKIGIPEFNIAQHTLQIIYNQTLFWMGLYFSPFLSLVVTVKIWLTWYIKCTSCLRFCKPCSKSWRAAQTQTVFLGMTFLALFAVIFVYGYIMTQVPTSSSCGPFRNYEFMYEIVTKGLFQLQQGHSVFKLILYLTKPGVITGILIGMSLYVYYLRAKSNAQIGMVELLREMLVLEAKDKEFLLTQISELSEEEWLHDIRKRPYKPEEIITERSSAWRFRKDFLKNHQTNNENSVRDLPGTSTEHIRPLPSAVNQRTPKGLRHL